MRKLNSSITGLVGTHGANRPSPNRRSLVYFAPIMRALSMDAVIPDRVMVGVLAVTLYLFSAMMTLTAVRRLIRSHLEDIPDCP